jgi:hypothetical protein
MDISHLNKLRIGNYPIKAKLQDNAILQRDFIVIRTV